MSVTRSPKYQLLLTEFPTLFNQQCISVGFGDGWLPLVREALKVLAQEPTTTVAQIKEKFGGLRLYADNVSEEGYEAIRKAENESFTVCEDCGQPGKARSRGWIRTLCDACFVANEAKKEARLKGLSKK